MKGTLITRPRAFGSYLALSNDEKKGRDYSIIFRRGRARFLLFSHGTELGSSHSCINISPSMFFFTLGFLLSFRA